MGEDEAHYSWAAHAEDLLGLLDHLGIVANPRAVRLIAKSDRKQDRTDAEQLARLERLDPQLLAPIRHRGQQAQEDLAFVRSRHSLVRARTALINYVRGVVITRPIAAADQQVETLSDERYPETRVLRQVAGVGPLTALTYVLTLEDPRRFRRSREVGPYLGPALCPGHQNGHQATTLALT